jgi:hypothetical protein
LIDAIDEFAGFSWPQGKSLSAGFSGSTLLSFRKSPRRSGAEIDGETLVICHLTRPQMIF